VTTSIHSHTRCLGLALTDSYNARTEQDAQSYLQGELEAINSAAKIALGLKAQRGGPPGRPYVLSFGATPTAHVAHLLGKETAYGELEL
jgi:hypothetical protein